jgi:hypothetical protein
MAETITPAPADERVAPAAPIGYDPNDHPESQLEPLTFPVKPGNVASPPPPEPPRISARLKRRAEAVGIPETALNRLDTESIEDWVESLEGQAQVVFEQRVRADALQQALRQTNQSGVNGVTTVPNPTPTPPEDDLGVDTSELHPALTTVLKKLVKDNAELRRSQEESNQRAQQQQAQTMYDTFDEAFASLGETYHSIFGAGNRFETPRESDESARRLATIRAIDGDVSKMTPKQIKDIIIKTAKRLYPPPKVTPPPPATDAGLYGSAGNVSAPEPASRRPAPPKDPTTGKFLTAEERRVQQQATDAQQTWLDGGLARPTHVNGAPEPNGRDKAIHTVEAILKERAAPLPGNESAGDAQLDDFPA